MKLIITGGLGFIGTHLLTELSKLNKVELTIITLRINKSDEKFLSGLNHKVRLIEGNLEEVPLAPIIQSADAVIHLAWQSNPSITGLDIDAELKLNWNASKKLIDACCAQKVKLVFLSSGGTVYGNPSYLPIDELHETNPTSAYGLVKLKVENEIRSMNESTGLEYLILRPSNAYGPGYDLRKGYGVIGFWADKIKKQESITIMGSGEIKRDFIHVSDLSSGIVHCLSLTNTEINIGAGYSISLNELKEKFESIIGKELQCTHTPSRPFDTLDNCLSIARIKKLTNWSPNIKIEEGIRDLF